MKLKIRMFVFALSLFTLFTIAATPAKPTINAKPSNTNTTFEGCWTQWPAGECKAVYRDANGVPYICGKCDSSGNPQPGKCSPTSNRTLEYGYWCS